VGSVKSGTLCVGTVSGNKFSIYSNYSYLVVSNQNAQHSLEN
jgi:hypothetical protein